MRGVARFSYARDKTESDRIVQLWALQHPDVITTIVRPCIVFGPNVDNYLVRLWTKQPFAVDAGNLDGTIQFVHEDDVVEAISRLLLGRHAGQFNLAADGLMTLRECAELLDTPMVKMPVRALQGAREGLWRLRLSEAPPADRLRALPVDRLEREAEEDARLDAEATAPARPSRSRCERRGSCRRRTPVDRGREHEHPPPLPPPPPPRPPPPPPPHLLALRVVQEAFGPPRGHRRTHRTAGRRHPLLFRTQRKGEWPLCRIEAPDDGRAGSPPRTSLRSIPARPRKARGRRRVASLGYERERASEVVRSSRQADGARVAVGSRPTGGGRRLHGSAIWRSRTWRRGQTRR